MSSNYSALVSTIFLVAVAVAANRASEINEARVSPRRPAATAGKKELLLSGVERSMLRHTEKLHGPVETSIELIGVRPEQKGDVFVLRGWIRSAEDLNIVDFKWSIPKEVEVINGRVQGQISALSNDRPASVEVTLKSLTGENHRIHLIASASRGGTRFAESSQYNTLLEPMLEASRKQLHKSTKESVKSQGKPSLKVFQ